jgi:hypothetical protein
MSQPDWRTREFEDDGQEPPAQSRPPVNRRAAVGAVTGGVLIVALGVAIFASLAAHRAPHIAAGATPTFSRMPAVTPTSATSSPQSPRHGVGLPEGVQIVTFVMTGPDEGWATGGVFTNPVTGTPDRGTIWRYSAGTWRQVGPVLPGDYLGSLFMDSPTDGWVMGGDAYAHSIFLHIRGGSWQWASPPAVDPHGLPEIIKMRSPNDGWLVMSNPKGAESGISTALYHFNGGTWSQVRGVPYAVTDLAPVARGEAWIIGSNTDGTSSLVHVQNGAASVELTSPGNSTFTRLRMFAPNDIWIEGAMHASSNADINDLPLDYHYDGAVWSNVNLNAPGGAQHINIVAPNTAWSFLSAQPSSLLGQSAYGDIAAISSNAGGQWSSVSAPYPDLQSLTVVSDSATDIWALGVYVIQTQLPSDNGSTSYAGVSHYVLLHYSDGSWTEWGR